MGNEVALKVVKITKHFGPAVALNNVSFCCNKGEIHALIGENGAGKSTLVNIISGCIKPDGGFIQIFGRKIKGKNPCYAIKEGVETVYQEGSLIPDLSVEQNFLIGCSQQFFSSPKIANHMVVEILTRYGIDEIDPGAIVKTLSIEQKQKLEITRALYHNPKVLLLDEATSALNPSEMAWFFKLLQIEKEKGTTVIIVSHRLDEIKGKYDRLTILKNGEKVGTFGANEIDENDVIKLMLGHEISKIFSKQQIKTIADKPKVEIKNLSVKPKLIDASFNIYSGEVVGVAGLAGQGQLELFEALYGIRHKIKGSILIDGTPVAINSPHHAIELGIVFIPPDRKEGLFLNLPIVDNMSLSILKKISHFGWINKRNQYNLVLNMMKQLKITPPKPDNLVSSLSGGNQQKVLIGKWMLKEAKILLLYDPTRGVDVGTKYEINMLIKKLSENGYSVLYYSTDIHELVMVADRVLVFYKGKIIDRLNEPRPEAVLAAVTGHTNKKQEVRNNG